MENEIRGILKMTDRCVDMEKNANRRAPKTRAMVSAIAIGIIVLGLAIGIPTKEDNKVGMRELSNLVMPFNFAHDKFSEFKYFVDTIPQKWGTNPEELLKLHDYDDPDNYGLSAYAIEDTELIVEFYYFENRLYQSTINMKDSNEANRWVGYLKSKFGEKQTDGKFSYWNRDELRIVYASESDIHRFYLLHVETFLAGQEYRKNVDSNLARLFEFKQVVENRVNWNTNPDSLPNISLYQKKELYQWDVYIHNNVANLDYHFFQNKLCAIDFLVWDSKQAKEMVAILISKFGEGKNERDNGTKWEDSGLTILSTPHTTARWFIFRHKKSWAEKEQYEKKYASTTQ